MSAHPTEFMTGINAIDEWMPRNPAAAIDPIEEDLQDVVASFALEGIAFESHELEEARRFRRGEITREEVKQNCLKEIQEQRLL